MLAESKPTSDGAVCVPLIPQELPEALLSHEWWDSKAVPSCLDEAHKVDLVYVLPEGRDEAFEEKVSQSFETHRMERFFAGLRFAYAELPPEKNIYIRESAARPANEYGLRAGPNHQFFFLFEEVATDYAFVFQMEVDCIAIRNGWLDRLHEEIDKEPDAWVIGSLYHGPALPSPWTDHLNGNAIYRSGSEGLREFYQQTWRRRTEEVVRFQRPEMAFDCAIAEYFLSDYSIEDYEKHFVVTDFVANMAPTLNYPRWKHSIRELSEDMPETCIVHAVWLLDEVKEILNFNESEWDRKFPSHDIDWSSVSWIWIKGFSESDDARFEGSRFSLKSDVDYVSWRLGCEVLPRINVEVLEGDLTIEIHRMRRSRRLWLKTWFRQLEVSRVIGRNLIFEFAMKVRTWNLEAKFERCLISITHLQFPGKKLLVPFLKIPIYFIFQPLIRVTKSGLIKSLFVNRNLLHSSSYSEGECCIDTAEIARDLNPDKHDVRISFINRTTELVSGEMDFEVVAKSGAASD